VSGEGPRLIAIGGGKGGTGKSFLAANLATFLATLGKRVVALDAALGDASLHGFLGVSEAPVGLGDALLGDRPLADLAVDTAVTGLRLIGGERDPAAIAELGAAAAADLVARLAELDADYVVLDLGPGTGPFAIELLVAADVPILAIAPEPTAIELGYRCLKVAFHRHAAGIARAIEALDVPEADAPLPPEGGLAGPVDLRRRAEAAGPDGLLLADEVDAAASRLAPFVVLNGVRSKADMDLGPGVARAIGRRLGFSVRYLGHVEYDDAVWVSLRRRRPLLIEHPESRAAKCVEKLTRRMLAREGEPAAPPPRSPESHYEILEIEPTASDEDLRRAHRRVRHLYARDSVVVVGLYGRARLDAFHRRIDEAYSVLMDPPRRKAYDQALFPDGIPAGKVGEPGHRATPEPAAERPTPPTIPVDAEFTGALLQRVREARGLELREISERTKVGMGYLAAIEEEDFARLPAPVYVRGFLAEYARMLGLDATRVLETYFERFRRAVGERPT
jgi:flagellar biosynthesis protein FlhG